MTALPLLVADGVGAGPPAHTPSATMLPLLSKKKFHKLSCEVSVLATGSYAPANLLRASSIVSAILSTPSSCPLHSPCHPCLHRQSPSAVSLNFHQPPSAVLLSFHQPPSAVSLSFYQIPPRCLSISTNHPLRCLSICCSSFNVTHVGINDDAGHAGPVRFVILPAQRVGLPSHVLPAPVPIRCLLCV